MKKPILYLMVLMPLLGTAQEAINAASLLSGSYLQAVPPSSGYTDLNAGDVNLYSPEALFDQSPKIWRSKKKADLPMECIIEFTELYKLHAFVIDTRVELEAAAVTKVQVLKSDVVIGFDFKPIGTYELNPDQINRIDIDTVEARRLKIVFLANNGHKKYNELREIEALGYYANPNIKTIDVTGLWKSNWGDIVLKQNGGSIYGAYTYRNGKVNFGGIDRTQLSFKWTEDITGPGRAILFMNAEGDRLTGLWCYNTDWSKYGYWIITREEAVPIETEVLVTNQAQPEQKVTYSANDKVVKELKAELEEQNKLILYGINFETNSAVLKESSKGVLSNLGVLLQEDTNLKLVIEGHTDSDGSDSYNLELSEKRAKAVRAYLAAEYKINDSRLRAKGMGESYPIADNTNAVGKAANRRVELKPF
ncbi:MAG: OmpA family protein [Owenweeksia sp.]|nr:OmpA family protein [Owenweeksia sp.]